MTHTASQGALDGKATEWLEQVSDERLTGWATGFLQKLPELFHREPGITDNAAERKSIDRVVSWNGNDAGAI